MRGSVNDEKKNEKDVNDKWNENKNKTLRRMRRWRKRKKRRKKRRRGGRREEEEEEYE
jgi:hypothetical protein